MILLLMAASALKSVAVNTKPEFVAHVTRLAVVIKLPTPIETMMVPSAFAAVAAAVASASAIALVETPLGSPSVRRTMRCGLLSFGNDA